jgi:hypothetical protein
MRRDHRRERWMLTGAGELAPGGDYAHRVIERLDAHPAGDRIDVSAGIRGFLEELGQEALDLGGWGVLAYQALDAAEPEQDERELVRAHLGDLIVRGAEALAVANDALAALDGRRDR